MLEQVSSEQRRGWQREVDAGSDACGCVEGAVALAFAVGALVAASRSGLFSLGGGRIAGSLVALALLFAAALLGKGFGLWRARRRRHRLLAQSELAAGAR